MLNKYHAHWNSTLAEYTDIVLVLRTEVIQKWLHLFHTYFLNFFGLYSVYIYFRNYFGWPLCFMQGTSIFPDDRISILWLQVSMTIKTKHSSAPTWYLMANAAAVYNSSIFIPTLFCRIEALYFPKATELFLQWFSPFHRPKH